MQRTICSGPATACKLADEHFLFRVNAEDWPPKFFEKSGVYELICGEGRLLAHKKLGRKVVMAEVVTDSRKEALLQSLVENIARTKPAKMDIASTGSIATGRWSRCHGRRSSTSVPNWPVISILNPFPQETAANESRSESDPDPPPRWGIARSDSP